MKRYDERDVLFSRMARKIGTPQYHAYYEDNPEKKAQDDELRKKTPMGDESAEFYDPHWSPLVHSTFQLLSDINKLSEGPEKALRKTEGSPEEMTKKLFEIAQRYGAKKVGITPYDSDYYYTHKGRTDQTYGLEIKDQLPFTVVFAVEMDEEWFMKSPKIQESLAVTKGYLDAGIIGLVLTYYIKSLGYQARNQMDGNYQMVLPLAAKYAGLGDIGRNGLLIMPGLGSRIRLGAISTDLPLLTTPKTDYDISPFCNRCKKCAHICPSQAISKDERQKISQSNKWAISHEKCYAQWQSFGTDCGLCIAKCVGGRVL